MKIIFCISVFVLIGYFVNAQNIIIIEKGYFVMYEKSVKNSLSKDVGIERESKLFYLGEKQPDLNKLTNNIPNYLNESIQIYYASSLYRDSVMANRIDRLIIENWRGKIEKRVLLHPNCSALKPLEKFNVLKSDYEGESYILFSGKINIYKISDMHIYFNEDSNEISQLFMIVL